MGVSKNRDFTPKMDGDNNGTPYEQMDDLGVLALPETNSEFTPENSPFAPKGNDRIPTIHFQV